jgi:membrane protease YdiL (CAAX protease family)
LIIIVAVFFGLLHIISGEPWSNGKFAQATASGIILGWLYFRFGLISAVLVHWATNYFIFSYVNFISQVSLISVEDAFSHSLIGTMEIIFLISGILSISIMSLKYFYSKRKPSLEV